MERLGNLLTFASGRRTKWLIVAGWVVMAVLLAPFAGRFEEVQENDSASFLPTDAQSTEALALGRAFDTNEQVPAIVVFRREAGLTADDLAAATTAQTAMLSGGIEGVVPAPIPPLPSADGKALLLVVPIAPGPDANVLGGAVSRLRVIAGTAARDGLQVAVTGPAGFIADAVEVFGSLDTRLLFSTAAIVAVLLLITYRSPILWLIPLFTVAFAEFATRGLGYWLGRAGLSISGQAAGILTVLVFGVATDYALLLTSRYREELRRYEDTHAAMASALRGAGPAILASAGTVIAALLCLLAAELTSNRGLGPISAIGVAVTLVAMLTLLPALLLLAGRRVFWPFVPRLGTSDAEESSLFARLGRTVAPRPRRIWIGAVAILLLLALGGTRTSFDLYSDDLFRASVESVEGAALLNGSFPPGASAATLVYVRPGVDPAGATALTAADPGVAEVLPPQVAPDGSGLTRFQAVLADEPYGANAFATVDRLRAGLAATLGDGALVGGPSAEEADVRAAATRDTLVIVPLILVAVLLILAVLLRSLLAPVLLMATVVLSFAAAFGVSVLVFEFAFGFPGIDPTLPLLAFLFLVALGVDYNIFLMDRTREESRQLGTRAGMLRALTLTGGVITAAGVVLAGTFSVLAVLPLVVLTQIGFIVAFGVLLDTTLVRSILVPALALDLGDRIWWPSALARRGAAATGRDLAVARRSDPVSAG